MLIKVDPIISLSAIQKFIVDESIIQSENIRLLIKAFYSEHQPHYYQEHLGNLEAFLIRPEFQSVMREWDKIIESIIRSIRSIIPYKTFGDSKQNNANKEIIRVLHQFLRNLRDQSFKDKDCATQFYGLAKHYFEQIAVLLNAEFILVDRKRAAILVLLEQASLLEEGDPICIVYLADVSDRLKLLGWNSWLSSFFVDAVMETANKKIFPLNVTYLELLGQLGNISEVKSRLFFLQQAQAAGLPLQFDYRIFARFEMLSGIQSQLLKSFWKDLERVITASHLVNYSARKLQTYINELAQFQEFSYEQKKIKIIELLSRLGFDAHFQVDTLIEHAPKNDDILPEAIITLFERFKNRRCFIIDPKFQKIPLALNWEIEAISMSTVKRVLVLNRLSRQADTQIAHASYIYNPEDLSAWLESPTLSSYFLKWLMSDKKPEFSIWLRQIMEECTSYSQFFYILKQFNYEAQIQFLSACGNPMMRFMFQEVVALSDVKTRFSSFPISYFRGDQYRALIQNEAAEELAYFIRISYQAGLRDFSKLVIYAPFSQFLQYIQLSEVNLSESDISDIQDVTLDRAHLVGSLFQGKLQHIQFSETYFKDVEFINAELKAVKFEKNCVIKGSFFLDEVKLSIYNMQELLALGYKTFDGVKLFGELGQNFSNDTFQKVSLSRQAFLYLVQKGVKDFPGVILENKDLRAQSLTGLGLPEACLIGSDVSYTDLTDTNLSKANLERIRMKNTVILNTVFTNAQLDENSNIQRRIKNSEENLVLTPACRMANNQTSFLTFLSYIKDPQCIENKQIIFKYLQPYFKELSNSKNVYLSIINFGLYLSMIESQVVGQQGVNQCLSSITRLFSQALMLDSSTLKQAEPFLYQMSIVAHWHAKLAQGLSISPQEYKDFQSFTESLRTFCADEYRANLSEKFRKDLGLKTIDQCLTELKQLPEGRMLHLRVNQYVFMLYKKNGHYGYFDSHIAWIEGFNEEQLSEWLTRLGQQLQTVKNLFFVEEFNAYKANEALIKADQAARFTSLQTELQRLAPLDQKFKALQLNGLSLLREELYELGLQVHETAFDLNSVGEILNSKVLLTQSNFESLLEKRQLSLQAQHYNKWIKQLKDYKLRVFIQATRQIPVVGGGKHSEASLRYLRDWAQNHYKFGGSWIDQRIRQLLNTTPELYWERSFLDYLRIKRPNQLYLMANPSNRILLARAGYYLIKNLHTGAYSLLEGDASQMELELISLLIAQNSLQMTDSVVLRVAYGRQLMQGALGLTSAVDIRDFSFSVMRFAKAITDNPKWRWILARISTLEELINLKSEFVLPSTVSLFTWEKIIYPTLENSHALELHPYNASASGAWHGFWNDLSSFPKSVDYLIQVTDRVQNLTNTIFQELQASPAPWVGIVVGIGKWMPGQTVCVEKQSKSTWESIKSWFRSDTLCQPGAFELYAVETTLDFSYPNEASRFVSRISPSPSTSSTKLWCLPNPLDSNFFPEIYIQANTSYQCDHAIFIADQDRLSNKEHYDRIGFDLHLVKGGAIKGSEIYDNYFINFPPAFLGLLIGGSTKTNYLDFSHMNLDAVCIKENAFYFLEANTTEGRPDSALCGSRFYPTPWRQGVKFQEMNYLISAKGLVDIIYCDTLDPMPWVISRGGNDRTPDQLHNCRKAVFSGDIYSFNNEPGSYTFEVMPTQVKAYVSIAVKGASIFYFLERDLLNGAYQWSIEKNGSLFIKNNGLSSQEAHFELEIANFWRQGSTTAPLVDRLGNIEPIISSDTTIVRQFKLSVETENVRIIQQNKMRWRKLNQGDSSASLHIHNPQLNTSLEYGSHWSDTVFLGKASFGYGRERSDTYILNKNAKCYEGLPIHINNQDSKYREYYSFDFLHIVEHTGPIHVRSNQQDCILTVFYNNKACSIELKRYWEDPEYQHIAIVDNMVNAWIPYREHNGTRLIPYYDSHLSPKSEWIITLESLQEQPTIAIASDEWALKAHWMDNSLYLIDEWDTSARPLILKFPEFYTQRERWKNWQIYLVRGNSLLDYESVNVLASFAISLLQLNQAAYLQNVQEYHLTCEDGNFTFLEEQITQKEVKPLISVVYLAPQLDLQQLRFTAELPYLRWSWSAIDCPSEQLSLPWSLAAPHLEMIYSPKEDIIVRDISRFAQEFAHGNIENLQAYVHSVALQPALTDYLSTYDEHLSSLLFLIATRHLLSHIPELPYCLGFDSVHALHRFLQENQKHVINTHKKFESMTQIRDVQTMSCFLVGLVAKAYTEGVRPKALMRCFDKFNQTQIEAIVYTLKGNNLDLLKEYCHSNSEYLQDILATLFDQLYEDSDSYFNEVLKTPQKLVTDLQNHTSMITAPISIFGGLVISGAGYLLYQLAYRLQHRPRGEAVVHMVAGAVTTAAISSLLTQAEAASNDQSVSFTCDADEISLEQCDYSLSQSLLQDYAWDVFKSHLTKQVETYGMSMCLRHTRLGDAWVYLFQIKPNWQARDEVFWTSRFTHVLLRFMLDPTEALTASSVKVLLLETLVLKQDVQMLYCHWAGPSANPRQLVELARGVGDWIEFGPYPAILFSILERFLPEHPIKHLVLLGMKSWMLCMMVGDWEYSHLAFALLVIPMIPTMFEYCRIPVTPWLSHLLNTFVTLVIGAHVFKDIPECPERLEQCSQDLEQANRRIEQGDRFINHGVSWFNSRKQNVKIPKTSDEMKYCV